MMKNLYNSFSTKTLRSGLLLAGLLGGATGAARAQALNYSTTYAANVAGTFTDLGKTGASIPVSSTDDANSSAQNIGFTFNYNNASFTQFVLNTNGLIRLGSAPPSVANLFANYEAGQAAGIDPISSTAAADVNLLMPFNFDLGPGTGTTDYQVATTGTAPNRVCTVQWTNVSDKSGSTTLSQYASFTFQVKLYETTNRIEFVYSTATASANTATPRFPTVGIKGSGGASGQDVLVSKTTSTAAWSTSTFITGQYTGSTHNFRSAVSPDAGRTYRFDAAPANDAAVSAVYTYGKLATPAALPHAVQALITNTGSAAQTNLVATLSVTGANTFSDTKTIASLAPGASTTVTFASYPATLAAGTNTVTVTIPTDANTANNSATYGQQVTTNRISYLDPTGTLNATGVGVGQAGGALAAKYTLPAGGTVSDVTLTFAASPGNASSYQVVLYDATGAGGVPGAVLYTSAPQTRTAVAATAVVAVPNVRVPASFYIAVKEPDNNPALAYQVEDPLRPNTYYYSLDAASNWTSVNTTGLNTRLAIDFGLASTVTATASAALGRAIAVYPNPSTTGVFALESKSLTAPGGLAVSVFNLAGQVVHRATLPANTTAALDLSALSAGLYTVQVRSGEEFTVQKVSITK